MWRSVTAIATRCGVNMHRGEVIARSAGRKPCLCGAPIVPGQTIVKRWNQWIHANCYDELSAAKQNTG